MAAPPGVFDPQHRVWRAGDPQFWLIKNKKTGHSVISWGTNPTSPAILKAVGANSPNDVDTFGGKGLNYAHFTEQGFQKLQIVSDQIPLYFQPKKGTDIQPVNFDLLNPVGTDPNKYQQGVSAAGTAAQNGVDLAKNLFSPSLFYILGGFVLLLFGVLIVAKGGKLR